MFWWVVPVNGVYFVRGSLYVLNKWEKLFKFWYIYKLYLLVLYFDIVINLIQIKL